MRGQSRIRYFLITDWEGNWKPYRTRCPEALDPQFRTPEFGSLIEARREALRRNERRMR